MKKHIKLIIGSIMIVVVVSVFAAQAMLSDNFKSDIKTVVNGILTPKQIGDLIEFKNTCEEKYTVEARRRPAPLKMWHSLDLTEDQQEKLLAIVDGRVDTIHPLVMQVLETGMQLKKAVLESDANTYPIDDLTTQLGEQIGVTAWDLAQVVGELKAVLTRQQQDLLAQHCSEHRLTAQTSFNQMSDFSDDLATLWNDLRLSPRQVDALTVVHKLVRRSKVENGAKVHEILKTEIEPLLAPAQSSLVGDFHNTHISENRSRFQEIMAQREQFLKDMDLSGEQKIELVSVLMDHREAVVDAAHNIAEAAFALHDAIHADTPDHGTVTKTAAGFGSTVGQAAYSAATLVTAAKGILTPAQLNLLDNHMDQHFDQHLAGFRYLPTKIHGVIDFLHALDLTPEQKEQIMKTLADHHKTGRYRHFSPDNTL